MDKLEEYNIECMLINDHQAQEDELIKKCERNSMECIAEIVYGTVECDGDCENCYWAESEE